MEQYDFILFGVCAVLIFGPQYFPGSNPLAAQLSALATFGAGFVVRPLGGLIAGHFGDRIGRKKVLIASFIVMGLSTAAIGIVPTYAQIGVWASVILVIIRLIQGLAVGAEVGGALLLAVEHAPPARRGFYAMTPIIGIALGGQLAQLVIILGSASLHDAFVGWGWRLAFLFSLVLVVLGVFARRNLTESPLFEEAIRNEPPKIPVLSLFREHLGAVIRGFFLIVATALYGYILVFALSYYTTQLKLPALQWMIPPVILVPLVSVPCMVLVARWGDKYGVRRVMPWVAAVTVLIGLTFFPLMATGSIPVLWFAIAVYYSAFYSLFALVFSVLSGIFPVNVGYSGVSLSYNLAYLVGGLAPLIATTVVQTTGSTVAIGLVLAASALAACVVVIASVQDGRRRQNIAS